MAVNGVSNGKYTLEDFTQDMLALVACQPSHDKLFDEGSRYLAKLVRNPDCLPPEYAAPSGRGRNPNHGSYALHRSPGLFISSVVWGPGDHLGPHDHNTWGLIGVIGNSIQETRFKRLDDGSTDGYAKVVKDKTNLVKPGEITVLVPEVYEIHEMNNFSDRPTVEVHVYGKDLVGLQRRAYNLSQDSYKIFASGKFDNC